jgi:hypothetical protein
VPTGHLDATLFSATFARIPANALACDSVSAVIRLQRKCEASLSIPATPAVYPVSAWLPVLRTQEGPGAEARESIKSEVFQNLGLLGTYFRRVAARAKGVLVMTVPDEVPWKCTHHLAIPA